MVQVLLRTLLPMPPWRVKIICKLLNCTDFFGEDGVSMKRNVDLKFYNEKPTVPDSLGEKGRGREHD